MPAAAGNISADALTRVLLAVALGSMANSPRVRQLGSLTRSFESQS